MTTPLVSPPGPVGARELATLTGHSGWIWSVAIAIERHPSRLQYIADNAIALGTPGLKIIPGSAPEASLSAQEKVFSMSTVEGIASSSIYMEDTVLGDLGMFHSWEWDGKINLLSIFDVEYLVGFSYSVRGRNDDPLTYSLDSGDPIYHKVYTVEGTTRGLETPYEIPMPMLDLDGAIRLA